MIEEEAIEAFAALAHPLRMGAFRLLMVHGRHGLPAGEVARRLDTPASTLSPHLARLQRAGLVGSRRERQRIFYLADTDGTQALMAFLVEDCCDGRPELCGYESTAARSGSTAG